MYIFVLQKYNKLKLKLKSKTLIHVTRRKPEISTASPMSHYRLLFWTMKNGFMLRVFFFFFFRFLSHPCTKCSIKYCEGAKMSHPVQLLAWLLGLGRALLKIYRDQSWRISLRLRDQSWRISLRLCIVLCVSQFYSTVIEFNVWLWNPIRIANYFPALILEGMKKKKLHEGMRGGRGSIGPLLFSKVFNKFTWNLVCVISVQ